MQVGTSVCQKLLLLPFMERCCSKNSKVQAAGSHGRRHMPTPAELIVSRLFVPTRLAWFRQVCSRENKKCDKDYQPKTTGHGKIIFKKVNSEGVESLPPAATGTRTAIYAAKSSLIS